ncbi:DUF2946 family protein [Xanthobacter sp. V4C-4]|uniref:DUF2946 family protein n=1 Tax=Xanthobacter cornucopiae TaxID=3119924 RepID=UPI00372AFC9E
MVAWTAAYALVLQIVLVSALSAGMARGPSNLPSPLCLNSATTSADDAGPPADDASPHCPLCLSRADPAVLPPPVPTPEIDRIAIELRHRAIVRDGLRIATQRRPSQPRAPPALG